MPAWCRQPQYVGAIVVDQDSPSLLGEFLVEEAGRECLVRVRTRRGAATNALRPARALGNPAPLQPGPSDAQLRMSGPTAELGRRCGSGMTDSRPARRPRWPWLRRVAANAAAWLLWRLGDPEGISPAASVALGAFMYFATGSRSWANSGDRATRGHGAEFTPGRGLCQAVP